MQRKTTQQWREQIIDVQNNLDHLKGIMLSDKSQYQKNYVLYFDSICVTFSKWQKCNDGE